MKKIVILGECMIELNGQLFGQMNQTYGGDTLNTATYLSRISPADQIQTYYFSVMGEDKVSQIIKEHWLNDGIKTDFVLADAQRQPGIYLIQLDEQGERSFLYWRNQSAARYLVQHPQFEMVIEQLKCVDMLYLSGISLAILPSEDRKILLERIRLLKEHGVKIAFDTNYRPNLWQNEQEAKACYTKMLAFTDIALVTFDDEQHLWQDQNIAQSVNRLSQFGIETLVIKDGRNGAICVQNQQTYTVPAEKVAQVVDTTSAGDSFNAGFLHGYLNHKPLDRCCQQGNQLAAIVIQHRGAIIDPTATEHLRNQFNA